MTRTTKVAVLGSTTRSFFGAVLLTLSLLQFVARPALADSVLFTSGPSTYEVDNWDLCGCQPVADTFTLAVDSTVDQASFVVWAFPGDTLLTIDWSILSSPLAGGTTYASGVAAAAAQTFIESNSSGYDIDNEVVSIPSVSLTAGTYWLELGENTVGSAGAPYEAGGDNDYIWWDENDNPGVQAWDGDPTLPSGFLVSGVDACASASCSETFTISGTTPEPGTDGLVLGGLLAMSLYVRRRTAR